MHLSRVWTLAAGLAVAWPLTAQEYEEVSFQTSDSVTVFGDLYVAGADRDAPIVLLFHQSGSSSREYDSIAPRLNALGYHALAIDARGGGGVNRTVARLPERGGGPQAYFDFKAAMTWVRTSGFSGPIVLWGSSYSAGRLFQILAERPDGVVAAVCFSPGAGFARRGEDASPSVAEQAEVPIFMTWAESELDDDRRARFARVASAQKVLFEQAGGVHGSSTLHPEDNPGWRHVWAGVTAFLEEHVQR